MRGRCGLRREPHPLPPQVDTRGGGRKQGKSGGGVSALATSSPPPPGTRVKAVPRPRSTAPPPGLDVVDGPAIEPSPFRQLLLGESQPEPGRPDPPRQTVPFRNEPRAKDPLDGRPTPGQGLALAALPARDRLRPATQPLSKGSLRQPQVHPPLADPLPERPRLVRMTPWELTRPRATDPQIAERQRNGVAVVGSGTRAEAASARRPRSRSTTRG